MTERPPTGSVPSLELDGSSTVVLTVDMQREYLDPVVGANLIADRDIDRVVRATSALLRDARERSIPVVHCYVTRRAQEIDGGFQKSPFAERGRREGIVQNRRATSATTPDRLVGSPGAELLGDLDDPRDIHITTKKTMDCFFGTELDLVLRRALNATAIVLAGINTDTCVLCTAFGASNHGYLPIVAADCVATMRGSDAHEDALRLMAGSFAWVLDSSTIWSAMSDDRSAAGAG
jgi:nicotinamidase-related amidase